MLAFDGRIDWQPQDAGDEAVRDLVDRHQRSDKGFGPALGPDAATYLRALLVGSAGELLVETSDWVLSDGRPCDPGGPARRLRNRDGRAVA